MDIRGKLGPFFNRSSRLPKPILAKMGEEKFSSIQADVQAMLSGGADARRLEALIAEAGRLKWPHLQRVKLEAFGHYYLGELGKAFEHARTYCGGAYGPEFDADLFVITLLCVFNNGQFEDAYRLLKSTGENERYVSDRADFHNIKGSLCLAVNRIEEARQAMDAARHLDPDDTLTAMNAYAFYFEFGTPSGFAALQSEIDGGRWADGSAFARSTPVLAQGNYLDGFRMLEARYGQGDANQYINPALPADLRWTGRAHEFSFGKTLLVTCEQGFGDTIMMARYFPRLQELTGGHLIIEAQSAAVPLLENSFPQLRFVSGKHGALPKCEFDLWIGSMSLPYVFGSIVEDIPARQGYLSVPPESILYWHERVMRLSRPGCTRVGVAWSGSPSHRSDRRRSMPFDVLSNFVLQFPEIDFFALQTVVPDVLPANLIGVTDEMITFADTAALIGELDLVITVDTSIVHVAGAIGKTTWLLLPKRYEWRWGLDGEENAWYDSVRVLRQPDYGDWPGLLSDIVSGRLLDLVSRGRGS